MSFPNPEMQLRKELEYRQRIEPLLKNLPNNSLTQRALRAIQSNTELPSYKSSLLQKKMTDLKNEYHHPQVPTEDLAIFQHVFQSCIEQKVTQVRQPQDVSLEWEHFPQELEKFSVAEINTILDIQTRYQLATRDMLEHIEPLAESRALDELIYCEEFIRRFIKNNMSYKTKVQIISSLSQFVQEKPLEELQQWAEFFHFFYIENIHSEDLGTHINILAHIFIDKSLGEAQNLLKSIDDVVDKDLPIDKKNVLTCRLLQAIENRSLDQSLEILQFIKNIIPQNSPYEKTFYTIKVLVTVIIKRPWEDILKYFHFFHSIPKNLPAEKQLSMMHSFGKALEQLPWEKFQQLQHFILSRLPSELPMESTATTTAFWMHFCVLQGLEIFLDEKYANCSQWILFAVPLLRTDLTERTVKLVLDELVPPKTNTVEEAKSLSHAVAPFFNMLVVTHPHSIQTICKIFREIPEPLRSKYSLLAKDLLKQQDVHGAQIIELISWIQETDLQTYTAEEFFIVFLQQLTTSDLEERVSLAYRILKYQSAWKLSDNDPLIQASKWPIAYHAYKSSLEKKLGLLPMNTLMVEALSKKGSTKSAPKGLVAKKADLDTLLNTISNYTTSFQNQEILRRLFHQKIQEKIKKWNNLSVAEQLQEMDSSFLKKTDPFPTFWETVTFQDKYTILQTAQFLIDDDTSIQNREQILLSLTNLFSQIPPKNQEGFLKFLDITENMKIPEKIEILSFLEEYIRKFSRYTDLEKVFDCVDFLILPKASSEEKIGILFGGIADALATSNLDNWVLSVHSRPAHQTLTRLILRVYCSDHAEVSEDLLLSLVREGMSAEAIKTILENLNRQKHPTKVAKALSPFMKKAMLPDSILLLFQAFNQVAPSLQIPYSKLLGSVLGPKASTSDVCILVELMNLLGLPAQVPAENFYISLEERLVYLSVHKPSQALKISRKIFDCQKTLKLSDRSPLIQQAMFIILEKENNKQHAYFIQAQIKYKKLAYPSSIIAQTISPTWIPQSTDPYPVQILLDLEGLQRGCRLLQKQKKSYREFKEWIEERNQLHKIANPSTLLLGPDFFKDFFKTILVRLDAHIKTNPTNIREIQKLRDEISESAINFTYEDRLVTKIMQDPFSEDDTQVPQITLRLYAIADAILQQSSAFSDRELLNTQEQQALVWLSLIENCSVGQERGTALCYHDLKIAGIIKDSSTEDSEELEHTQIYLAEVVQQAMHDVITSPDIIRDFGVSKNEFKNKGVHQELYLQNMTGPECGLDHQEKIDPYPKEISQELLRYDREYLLQVFFYRLSQQIVSSLRASINGLDPSLKNKRYNFLQAYFTHHHIDPKKAWDLQESPFKVYFLRENKEVPITLSIVGKCLSEISSELELWTQNEQDVQLTLKGISQFRTFLNNNSEDPSLIDHTGKITEQNAMAFLLFVENIQKEKFYNFTTQNLTSQGEELFLQEIKNTASSLYAFLQASFRQSGQGRSWEAFIEQQIRNFKNLPILRKHFLQICAKHPMPWSLKQPPMTYEITEFGALALLENEGYLHTLGPYADYLRVANEIQKLSIPCQLQKKIQRIQRIPEYDRKPEDRQNLSEAQNQLDQLSSGQDPMQRFHELTAKLSIIERSLQAEVPEDVPPIRPGFSEKLI